MKNKKPFDFWIFITVMLLVAMGTIMVFSASAPYAYNTQHGNTFYFLQKQIIGLVMGLVVMFFAMNIDYRRIAKWSPLLLAMSIVLLILVCIPGIGQNVNGATRWINLGFTTIQPSEFAKLSIILFFSYSLSKRKQGVDSFFKGLLPYLMLLGIIAVLLLLEPHLSGTMIICMVATVILFAAGAKIKHFILLSIPAITGLGLVIAFSEYRRARVLSFLNPWADVKGDGYQVIQSLLAIGSGGLFGRGIGKSIQKHLYLPEPHNDFIFSVLAEELGFIGVIAVMLLFLIFIWRGIKVAMNAPDVLGSLIAIGITTLISLQAVINIAVVTSSMPVTGMPLPFFSYGGTSLMFLLCNVGILLNISKYANYERI